MRSLVGGFVCVLVMWSAASAIGPEEYAFQFRKGYLSYPGCLHNFIEEADPDDDNVSHAEIQLDSEVGARKQGLLKFPSLVGAAPWQLPPNCFIKKAELKVLVDEPGGIEGWRSKVAWDVYDETWNTFPGGDGVKAEHKGDETFTIFLARGGQTITVTDIVKKWFVGIPEPNYGFLLEAFATHDCKIESESFTGWPMLIIYVDLVPGDADNDGDVDVHDFLAMQAHMGQSGGWKHGDFNRDGVITSADWTIWAANDGYPEVGCEQ